MCELYFVMELFDWLRSDTQGFLPEIAQAFVGYLQVGQRLELYKLAMDLSLTVRLEEKSGEKATKQPRQLQQHERFLLKLEVPATMDLLYEVCNYGDDADVEKSVSLFLSRPNAFSMQVLWSDSQRDTKDEGDLNLQQDLLAAFSASVLSAPSVARGLSAVKFWEGLLGNKPTLLSPTLKSYIEEFVRISRGEAPQNYVWLEYAVRWGKVDIHILDDIDQTVLGLVATVKKDRKMRALLLSKGVCLPSNMQNFALEIPGEAKGEIAVDNKVHQEMQDAEDLVLRSGFPVSQISRSFSNEWVSRSNRVCVGVLVFCFLLLLWMCWTTMWNPKEHWIWRLFYGVACLPVALTVYIFGERLAAYLQVDWFQRRGRPLEAKIRSLQSLGLPDRAAACVERFWASIVRVLPFASCR